MRFCREWFVSAQNLRVNCLHKAAITFSTLQKIKRGELSFTNATSVAIVKTQRIFVLQETYFSTLTSLYMSGDFNYFAILSITGSDFRFLTILLWIQHYREHAIICLPALPLFRPDPLGGGLGRRAGAPSATTARPPSSSRTRASATKACRSSSSAPTPRAATSGRTERLSLFCFCCCFFLLLPSWKEANTRNIKT